MEQRFRNHQINHKFQEKDRKYYCGKLIKRKVKPNIQPESLVLSEQTEPEHDIGNVYKQEMYTWKLTKDQKYQETLVAYLCKNNPSEEAIFGSNKIKRNMKQ